MTQATLDKVKVKFSQPSRTVKTVTKSSRMTLEQAKRAESTAKYYGLTYSDMVLQLLEMAEAQRMA